MGRGGFEPPKALGQLIYSQSRLTTSVSARPGDSTDNRLVEKARWVVWEGLADPSFERCNLLQSASGWTLSGLILRATRDAAYVARYAIELDDRWHTKTVEVELENGAKRRLRIEREEAGRWLIDGRPEIGLERCVDVDLEWTPATNTLPIRRLSLQPGAVEWVTAAWVRFPSLEIEPLHQSYERVDDRRYQYRAGDFTADLETDEDGVVTQYGGGWRAVASGPPA